MDTIFKKSSIPNNIYAKYLYYNAVQALSKEWSKRKLLDYVTLIFEELKKLEDLEKRRILYEHFRSKVTHLTEAIIKEEGESSDLYMNYKLKKEENYRKLELKKVDRRKVEEQLALQVEELLIKKKDSPEEDDIKTNLS